MEATVPMVTPRMAPAATYSMPLLPSRASCRAISGCRHCCRISHARGSPMPSLHRASSTWETAVGFMLPWPWV